MLSARLPGGAGGRPLVVLGGAPGTSRLDVDLHAEAARRHGFEAIGVDRPGTGRSSRHENGTLADWALDLGELLDHVGHRRFAVMSLSGGAPFALAAGQYLADRVAHLTLVAPGWLPSHRWTKGMVPANRVLWWLARNARRPFGWMFSAMAAAIQNPEWSLADTMPEVDRQVMVANPALEKAFRASFAESIRNGVEGVLDDAQRVASPRGVYPGAVPVPVDLWHGEADQNVPVRVGRALAGALPHCTGHFLEGEGHISILARHRDVILEAIPR